MQSQNAIYLKAPIFGGLGAGHNLKCKMKSQNARINHKAQRASPDNRSNKTSKQHMKQRVGPPEPRADGARMVKYL